jgi:hypothetical protein
MMPQMRVKHQICYTDETCRAGEVKFWGEDSVSEDFDMYIRLASVGSFGRYVMYTGDEFQEGISLTYMDEVVKFKKVTPVQLPAHAHQG